MFNWFKIRDRINIFFLLNQFSSLYTKIITNQKSKLSTSREKNTRLERKLNYLGEIRFSNKDP